MKKILRKLKNRLFGHGLTCPDCGKDTLQQSDLADWCDECGYYFYYG